MDRYAASVGSVGYMAVAAKVTATMFAYVVLIDSCFGVVVPPSETCSIVGIGIPYAVLCATCSSSSSLSEATSASSESSEGSGSSFNLLKSGDSMYGSVTVPNPMWFGLITWLLRDVHHPFAAR